MKDEMNDINFIDGMKNILGMEEDDVEKLIDSLDADTLLDLTNAISNSDKEAAEKIISRDEDVNDLFYKATKKKKKHPVKPPKDHQFMHGDDVAFITVDDDGKKIFRSATVSNPNGPGNTVVIKNKGKTRMVDRSKLYTLKEGVLGMIGVPGLQRIQQLAGISEPESSDVKTQAFPSLEKESWFSQNNNFEETECPVEKIMCALDVVASALPEIKLADLKVVRQKIYDIQAKMNESLVDQGRKKKI
jgi:hypothetical protein